jgi:hypothetical protein
MKLFYRFTVKVTVLKIIYSLATCCGGMLCGPVVYIRQIRETGFTLRAPLFEKS